MVASGTLEDDDGANEGDMFSNFGYSTGVEITDDDDFTEGCFFTEDFIAAFSASSNSLKIEVWPNSLEMSSAV